MGSGATIDLTMPASFRWILFFLSVLILGALACSLRLPDLQPAPTSTLTSTLTPVLFFTPTPPPPRPTETPQPTNTPTQLPTPTPTALLLVDAGTPLPEELPILKFENSVNISAIASWKESDFAALAWAPDSARLAIASNQEIGLYDVNLRRRERSIEADQGITSLAYSPRGNLIVAGNQLGNQVESFAGNIDMWRPPLWERIDLLYSPSRAVSNVAFSQQGDLLAAALSSPVSQDNNVYIWNTYSFEISRTLTTGTVLDAVFSPDGKIIATTPDRYAIKLWQIKDGRLLHSLPTSFTGAVNSIAFSPDGTTLATGHYDGIIRLWDVGKGALLLEIKTNGVVESLAYNPDGSLLATGGSYDSNSIRLWDPTSGALLHTLEGHKYGVNGLAFSPDGTLLASGSYDGVVFLWGVRP